MQIHPQLKRSDTKNLCSVDECKLMSLDAMELYILKRKLSNAKTVEQLDNYINNFKLKFPKVALDETVLKTYQERTTNLKSENSAAE